VQVGDRVVNLHRPFCGECRTCVSGDVVDCERAWQSFGHTIDGAYAELCVAPERALVKLPAGIDFVAAASVGCTAAVALRALRKEAALRIGERVLVTGASGGVGLMAIQVAKAAGAHVIAVTGSEAKADALREAGAHDVIVTGNKDDDAFEQHVRALTDGGVDVALELVGRATFTSSMKSLRRGGRLVLLGNITLDRVTLNPGALILFGTRVCGSHGYSPRDLEDCFAMMLRKTLVMKIDRTLPLERAADAHRLLHERAVRGRIVLVPTAESVAR
jgi:NADPH:quinone reductase-like Zn-dependent oxidoreductase